MSQQRQTELVLLYRGGSNSSGSGVSYPVVLRNIGIGTFWDVDLRATHDGEETDRKSLPRVGPESESDPQSLLIPAKFCDQGTPGVGLRPLGRVVFEALHEDQVVASAELPDHRAEKTENQESMEDAGNSAVQLDRVPRTPAEEEALLRERPDGWEFLLFAAVLRRRVDELEPEYRDHEIGFAPSGPGPVLRGLQASEFLADAFNQAGTLTSNLNRVLDPAAQERAFGALGEPGDAQRIEHLASRMIDIYGGLIAWAGRLRATLFQEEFRRAAILASRFVDQPIQQFRDFVDRVVAKTDQLPSLLREERAEPLTLTLTIVLSIEEGLEEELGEELRRLEELSESGELDLF